MLYNLDVAWRLCFFFFPPLHLRVYLALPLEFHRVLQAFAHLNAAAHYAIVERPAVGIVSGLVVSSLVLGVPQRTIKRMVFNMWGETAVLQRIEGRIVDMKGARACVRSLLRPTLARSHAVLGV